MQLINKVHHGNILFKVQFIGRYFVVFLFMNAFSEDCWHLLHF